MKLAEALQERADLNKKIAEFGLKITSKTDVYGWDRGAGIICWLENNPGYDKWIVIDDEIFPDYKNME